MRAAFLILGMAIMPLVACQKPEGSANGGQIDAAATSPTTPGLPSVAPAAVPVIPSASLGQGMDAKSELRMDVVEAVRVGGVVTIKIRATLVGGKSGSRPVPGASSNGVYLSAADKKYMLLKDDAGKELMSTNTYPDFAQMGSTSAWWGKFPAPPAEVKAVNVYFTDFEPVENVPLTDR